MDFLQVHFPLSGVTTNVLVPPLVSMVISFFTSMGGLSGAFLILPYQMSVLNYTAPSVSGTNLVYNIVAIPSGVYRYFREGRMVWLLTWVLIAGTLPGVFLGYLLRIRYLPDPRAFKVFVGAVLLYVGTRMVRDLVRGRGSRNTGERGGLPSDAVVKLVEASLKTIAYEYGGQRYSFSPPGMLLLALIVGIVGGAYGIGGGAIIAPFCVAIFHLPIHTIAGATLMSTFVTSIAGASFFSLIPASGGVPAMPDWPLGILFGLGGLAGMYFGARAQKYVPQALIKAIVGCMILFLAVSYILQYFL